MHMLNNLHLFCLNKQTEQEKHGNIYVSATTAEYAQHSKNITTRRHTHSIQNTHNKTLTPF